MKSNLTLVKISVSWNP